jgi:hypothetical protein
MDRAGNIVWRKEVHNYNGSYPTHRKILYDGHHIYTAGDYLNTVQIDKFDTTGNRVWAKRFRLGSKSTSVEGLFEIADSLYLITNIWTTVNVWARKHNLGV